ENKKTISIDAVRLLAPVPRPRQMRDCMLFEKHLKQAGQQIVRSRLGILGKLLVYLGLPKIPKVWYDQPIYYKANRFSVIGTEQDVIWPSYSNMMDFECEMGIVIGKEGKDIQKENAKGHIFGYLIFNDMSARDAQFKEMAGRLGPAKGKDFDTGNILGPWLVTKDEIPDPYNLTMIARVNGEEWGRGNSGDMHHKFEELIAHVSNCETLYPGEILGSGTVGDGCGLEHGRFLKPGDVIELEVSKLGVLRNRIVKP
ncbi:MAG: fumarylacetoacetate hydrolase family protein, partial [Deltaproteobacteria bacterium]|nr:fumarylacetoacetate hydrolase family protein [Deltaproteobacteria bacterium]MBW2366151.1 fumarylacetoacetate hydrolase family protein [Deltaproteobacteria bacterium]